MTSDKCLGSSGTESRVHENDSVTLSRRIGLIGHSGFTMAKVDVPCVFKNPSGSDVDV